jgi:serine/threonine protein kinase
MHFYVKKFMARGRLATSITFSSIKWTNGGPRLGRGQYGVVYPGERPASKGKRHDYPRIEVAVKVWHKEHLSDITQQRQFMREIEISMSLQHPAILPLYCFSISPVATVAPRMSSDLKKLMNEPVTLPDGRPLVWDATKRSIAAIGIPSGMAYLHANGVIHRDLKPENVMVDERTWPRIADFGFSRFVSVEEALKMTAEIGSPLYMAPELYTDEPYNTPVDVYAYAMLLFQLCTGRLPFPGVRPGELNRKIMSGKRPNIPESVSAPFAALITACWAHNQLERPTFAQIIERMMAKGADGAYEFVFEGTDIAEYEEYLAYVNAA